LQLKRKLLSQHTPIKTTLTHLPQQKQEEILAIADAVKLLTEPAMIILFGSYARGNFVDDEYASAGITYSYNSDYDILVIVEDEHRADLKAKVIRDSLRKHLHHDLQVQVILHGIDYFNTELEDGQYFFSDIVKEGVILYDNKAHKLKKAKPKSPAERANTSQMYFDKWFPQGNAFLRQFEHACNDGALNVAAFELHQTAERYFTAISLVYTHYKHKTHNLNFLYKNAVLLDDRFKQAFPLTTKEEKALFDILVKAYIDSRYKMNYSINVEELEYLGEHVHVLQTLTETICTEAIAGFRNVSL
jgi:predicted nucleotidyltransferase/HEPN domain-containing protein